MNMLLLLLLKLLLLFISYYYYYLYVIIYRLFLHARPIFFMAACSESFVVAKSSVAKLFMLFVYYSQMLALSS